MASYSLVIGNKNFSSWSMRPWLAMKATGYPFEEIQIALRRENSKAEILRYSPSGKVPVLLVDGVPVWDSLAISMTLAEHFPQARLWPQDATARAHCRSITAEMHSGFMALRTQHAMDMTKREVIPPSAEAQGDIDRITQLWADARKQFGQTGDFLFGHFTIADAMYAPVVSRFVTYGFTVGKDAQRYMDTIWNMPAFQEWYAGAVRESEGA